MGSIANKLRNRIATFKAEQQERSRREAQVKVKEREAYNQAYESGRIVKARKEGYERGSQGSGFAHRATRVAEGFGRSAELMFGNDFGYGPKRKPQHKKSGAVHVYVHTGSKPKKRTRSRQRRKDPYLEMAGL